MTKLDDILAAELNSLREKDLLWNIKQLQGPSVPRARVDNKEVLMLCSNNYLGLSDHPALKEAAIEAVKKYGAGSGSVRAIAGTMDLHVRLEEAIAKFKKTPDCIYYQSGFTANSGAIPQLGLEGDLLISDELNHGSIIDGVRLSKAGRAIFKHKDMRDLRRVLEENKGKAKKTWILTDGVFSMDGDIAPLPDIVKLAQEYGAYVFVDDAHGDGVLGEHGRGITDHFHLHGQVECDMGTFSKGFGTVGGYIAGSKTLKEFLLNKSRTYLLTGSHPPAVVAASIAAIELLEKDDSLVEKLWENTKYFKGKLKEKGFDTGESETPITPIMLGESSVAKKFAQELFLEGVFALPIVFPMVAQGKARIRTMVTAAHSREDLDFALGKIEKVGQGMGVVK